MGKPWMGIKKSAARSVEGGKAAMKIAYFDCFAGASGDMILGALLDAGLALDALKQEIEKLTLSHYDLRVEPVSKNGIGGSRAIVEIDQEHHHHHHRHLSDIRNIIGNSTLAPAVQQKSLEIFERLATVEAHVHRTALDQIYFHEVGAMDAIIDVVGAVAGLHLLDIQSVYCSPLHVGSGTVHCAHGVLPVPAPATMELIRGKPVYSTGVRGELLTPTGAAILTTLAAHFGPMPAMVISSVGYGAGDAELDIPNLLRVALGSCHDHAHPAHEDHHEMPTKIKEADLKAHIHGPSQ